MNEDLHVAYTCEDKTEVFTPVRLHLQHPNTQLSKQEQKKHPSPDKEPLRDPPKRPLVGSEGKAQCCHWRKVPRCTGSIKHLVASPVRNKRQEETGGVNEERRPEEKGKGENRE